MGVQLGDGQKGQTRQVTGVNRMLRWEESRMAVEGVRTPRTPCDRGWRWVSGWSWASFGVESTLGAGQLGGLGCLRERMRLTALHWADNHIHTPTSN